MLVGVIILLLAGICQGSFGLGYKNYAPLKWEAFWFVYSFFSIIVTCVYTLCLVPDYFSYFSDIKSVMLPIFCGALWGISAVAFSKGVTFIGMALVYGISMGISAVVGSIVPLLTQKELPAQKSLVFLAIGIVITLIGIVLITKAGILKDKQSDKENNTSTKLGLVLSALSGLGSGAMNIGFDAGDSFTVLMVSNGISQTALSSAQWLPVLVSGCTASMVYCSYELFKKKSWNCFTQKGVSIVYFKLFLTSIVWFMALMLYGIASQKLGDLGKVVGWIAFNALALIIGNIWGLITKEWKGAPKACKMMLVGSAFMILSWIFIAQV